MENSTVGPPTPAKFTSQLQDRTIILEQQIETLSEIITDNLELIKILRAELDDVYQPTEPWHTEIAYIQNRLDAQASSLAAHKSIFWQHLKNRNNPDPIQGRRP